ncbi:ABC transporter permease [Paenibacillus sacheonensis]|uniref:FtsX-like permease family protein n=1 Tax=Paenibacillus sacheonensis TaxID=742054 RepID=A0A7X4YNL1_9BACL|nr:ABC transporter permease [Paenibacillus sacheonensis]MBM7565447.1 putative ABC transport system permease protein [Paenibacillus sacheonensis]NBC69625.1 FtsX-like permease family protein [Paenibacillus sacheonensis]
MAIITMIFRKMAKNRWLQLNLWLGLTICVALFSSMPLYSHAILQRTLFKELQQLQKDQNVYPGLLRATTSVSGGRSFETTHSLIQKAERYMEDAPRRLGLDSQAFIVSRSTQSFRVLPADASDQEKREMTVSGSFRTVSDLEKRVKIIDGRLPDPKRSDGVYEALVTQKFIIDLKRDLGKELLYTNKDTGDTIRIIPVGIVESKQTTAYDQYNVDSSNSAFFIPFEQFNHDFVDQQGPLKLSVLAWQYSLDYEQMNIDHIETYLAQFKAMTTYFNTRIGIGNVEMPAKNPIATYTEKKDKLNLMLWSLYSPVMFMLAFYLYMAANLIIDRQKTEISVLRSRGASRMQIMSVFLIESVMLGVLALAAGPFIGVYFTKLLGASSGFLEFVQRASLDVALNSLAYRIAAAAVAGSIVLILIPAFLATKVTIVGHKQRMARMTKLSFWHKIGADFILMGISIYMLYRFNNQLTDLKKLALDPTSIQVDPLMFFMPAVFSLGAGLFILRIYPWFIKLVFWIGRKWWTPALYSTLLQISRSSSQYLTIKVFLIMTIATGLFSANAARTINGNMEDRIQYTTGSDIQLSVHWDNDKPPPPPPGAPQAAAPEGDTAAAAPKVVTYTEPSFITMTGLEGVDSAARVFRKDDASFAAGGQNGAATLYGIDTYDFGKVAWMRGGLLQYPLNSYLNLLASNPKAVLVSRSMAKQFKVKTGDTISAKWEGLDSADFIVYGIVDYWPGWSPLPMSGDESDPNVRLPNLIVGQLPYIQNHLALEPYEVWIKLKDGVGSKVIYDDLIKKEIPIENLVDANQLLIRSKNDPFRLAINGVMTLGFVISMLISFFGFLLFWVLTLSSRTLQFGILRAMGISFRQIIGMLLSEQLLTSAAAILFGVVIGNTVSSLFVPLFQLSFNASDQVPPFSIVRQLSDYVQLYSVVGFMLAIGLAVLGVRVSRMKITQALKLGEE